MTKPIAPGFRKSKGRLFACGVPWMVSPSMSGLTLQYQESDSGNDCSIVFGAGRLQADGKIDSRRVELTFRSAGPARFTPKPDDGDIELEGFEVWEGLPAGREFQEWLASTWRGYGFCPLPGLWTVTQSRWLKSLSIQDAHHYLLVGRSCYIEVVATDFSWKEWIWTRGEREALKHSAPDFVSAS